MRPQSGRCETERTREPPRPAGKQIGSLGREASDLLPRRSEVVLGVRHGIPVIRRLARCARGVVKLALSDLAHGNDLGPENVALPRHVPEVCLERSLALADLSGQR
jgi:hypothetical protein